MENQRSKVPYIQNIDHINERRKLLQSVVDSSARRGRRTTRHPSHLELDLTSYTKAKLSLPFATLKTSHLRPRASPRARTPSSRSITSSALSALPPQTTTPSTSTAHAPALCHLFPITKLGPSGSLAVAPPPPPALPVRWIDRATLSPSHPVSFQPWICVAGFRTDQREERPRPHVA